MTPEDTKFMELLVKYDDELLCALERRHSTSSQNKEKHQKVIDVLNSSYVTNQDLLNSLNQDEYYKYKQLDGVLWVMKVDNSVKVDILASYNIWLETFNKGHKQ